MHDLAGLFLVAVVLLEQTDGMSLLQADAQLAGLAHGHLVAVGIKQRALVNGRGLAHGTDLVGRAQHVADDHGGFGLTEALQDLQQKMRTTMNR